MVKLVSSLSQTVINIPLTSATHPQVNIHYLDGAQGPTPSEGHSIVHATKLSA